MIAALGRAFLTKGPDTVQWKGGPGKIDMRAYVCRPDEMRAVFSDPALVLRSHVTQSLVTFLEARSFPEGCEAQCVT